MSLPQPVRYEELQREVMSKWLQLMRQSIYSCPRVALPVPALQLAAAGQQDSCFDGLPVRCPGCSFAQAGHF
jgi:hypothetical protein